MSPDAPARCEHCGFVGPEWRLRDVGDLFELLGFYYDRVTAGAGLGQLSRPARPDGLSALDHGEGAVAVAGRALAGIGPAETPDSSAGTGDLAERIAVAGAAVAAALKGTERDDPATAHLVDATHRIRHHCRALARALVQAGAGVAHGEGSVAQVNASDGGVPKRPIPGADVHWRGLSGDRQAATRFHGRPFQAVCLWSLEVIDRLRAAGHPIGPGSAGENLTLAGVAWASLRPGTELVVGTTRLELSFPAVPCAKQARWFTDGDFHRIGYERHPEWVRWYAWVLSPGTVQPADPVVVEPG